MIILKESRGNCFFSIIPFKASNFILVILLILSVLACNLYYGIRKSKQDTL